MKEKKGVVEVEEELTFDQLKKLLTKDDPKRDRIRLSLGDKKDSHAGQLEESSGSRNACITATL